MAIPIFDRNIMPAITKTLISEQERTKQYLGSRTEIGEQYATINFFIETDILAEKLYRFWLNDCNGGTTNFKIALPIFGFDSDIDYTAITAKFIDKIIINKVDTHSTATAKIKIISHDGLMPSSTLTPSATLTPN